MIEQLNIFCNGTAAATLCLDEKRAWNLQYDSAWLKRTDTFPISVTLPLQAEPLPGDDVRNFFSNLLPEGHIRSLIAKEFGISARNDWELLKAIGGECAGALSLLPPTQTYSSGGSYQKLSTAELAAMLGQMPRRPLLRGVTDLRLSLAGAQNKLPVFIKESALYLPRGSFASSHILKPAVAEYPDIVLNEAFCMQLAEVAGLPVAKVQLWPQPQIMLLVARYDRSLLPDGTLTRLHQEDFCQALGVSPDQKYQSEGGPDVSACFTILQQHSVEPLLDKRFLLQWIIFNYLIGNADGHAKNISLLTTSSGLRLAPFYDLLSTAIYPALSPKLAMKIGGENRLDWIQARHWERLASDADVKPRVVLDLLKDMGTGLPKLAQTLAEKFSETKAAQAVSAKIVLHIQKQASAYQRPHPAL